jgi:hypothetical protein
MIGTGVSKLGHRRRTIYLQAPDGEDVLVAD